MRKGINLCIILMMCALVLVGCGEMGTNSGGNIVGESGSNQEQQDQAKQQEQQEQIVDLTTVDGWFSYWGLSVEDLTPTNYTRLDKTAYNIETGIIKDVGAYVDKELTNEEARAWIEKVLSKITTLSEEGKVTNALKSDTELTTDSIMERSMHIGVGKFTYNGKTATVSITVTPKQLDNSDPDIAMPACTLSLEH